MNHEWTDEELDELHNNLYAFLSFMDADTLEIMGKRQPIVVGHVRALKRALEMQLNDHGGRCYKQATLVTSSISQSTCHNTNDEKSSSQCIDKLTKEASCSLEKT